MKNPNTFNSMPTYGELEKLKELTPPNQMSEEKGIKKLKRKVKKQNCTEVFTQFSKCGAVLQ